MKPSIRRGVAMVEVVDGIRVSGDVVGPFEVDAHGFVGAEAEGGAFDGEMKVFRSYLKCGGADGFPRFAVPTLHAGFVHSAAGLIDADVVTVAAGLGILIGVEQQDHPIGISGSGERLASGDVEVEMRRVVGDMRGVEVIEASLVRVTARAGHAVVIAVRGIVQVIEIDRLHLGPLSEVAGDGDGLRG